MYLNCKTNFSFRYGTFSTGDLVKKVVDLGITSLTLTNINSTCDDWEFVRIAGAFHGNRSNAILLKM